jgi:hypothetical protein
MNGMEGAKKVAELGRKVVCGTNPRCGKKIETNRVKSAFVNETAWLPDFATLSMRHASAPKSSFLCT